MTHSPCARRAGPRDLLYFSTPALWPTWPFLCVIRHRPVGDFECGVMFDVWHAHGLTGFGATIFLANVLLLPQTGAEFFALPREVYDSAEEVASAGWVVD